MEKDNRTPSEKYAFPSEDMKKKEAVRTAEEIKKQPLPDTGKKPEGKK